MTSIIALQPQLIHLCININVMKIIQWLTAFIAILALIASAGGLLFSELYRDNATIKTAWLGNDLVTLLIIPFLLLAAYRYQRKQDYVALLILLGLLLYMFYNYAFYLFGARFNAFFLVYAALFTLCLYALVLGLLEVSKAGAINVSIKHGKIIAAFLILIALPLAIVEVSQCVRFIAFGKEPQIPSLVFALDLSLVIPNCILAAILLWMKRAWGITLSAMMLVKAFTYGMVLIVGTLLIGHNKLAPLDPLLPFYIFVATGGCFFGWLLFLDLRHAIKRL
jgi:hypothetical protein